VELVVLLQAKQVSVGARGRGGSVVLDRREVLPPFTFVVGRAKGRAAAWLRPICYC
jgi:hypothetical protein